MSPSNEPVRIPDTRSGSEIMRGIYTKASQLHEARGDPHATREGARDSIIRGIFQDVLTLDDGIRKTHPLGIFGFPLIETYLREQIGAKSGVMQEALQVQPQSDAEKDTIDRLREILIPTTRQTFDHLRQRVYPKQEKEAESQELARQTRLDETARETTGIGVDPERSVFNILLANLRSGDLRTSSLLKATLDIPKERTLEREVHSLMEPNMDTAKSQELGRAIELLSEGDVSQELINQLMLGLRINRQYRQRHYTHTQDRAMFLHQLPGALADRDEETLKIHINLPGVIQTIQNLTQTLSQVQQTEPNAVLSQITDSLKEISESPLFKELGRLSQDPTLQKAPPVSPRTYIISHPKTEGITDLDLKAGNQTRLAQELMDSVVNNRGDCLKLESTTIKMLSLLYLASFQGQMKSLVSEIASPEVGQELEVVEARHLHRLLLVAALGGKPLSELKKGEIKYVTSEEEALAPVTSEDLERIIFGRAVPWPQDYDPQECLSYLKGLDKSITVEKAVSLKFIPEKPIIILTGSNGSGKSSAENTIATSIALATVAGVNPGARVVKLSELMTNIRRSDPAISTNTTSTFQSEALFLSEALSTLTEGDILFVDEVGRGTDSRDAVSLVMGIQTHCLETGINLVVASHYGPQILDLSEKLGIRNKLRVMGVNPQTRQLLEVSMAEKSSGVEVFRQRAEGKIPSAVLDPLITNAASIRAASLNGGSPELLPFPTIASQQETIRFTDLQSLKDISLGNALYTMLKLTTNVWYEGEGRVVGESDISFRRVKRWEDYFRTKLQAAAFDLGQEGLAPIHTLIDNLVKYIPEASLSRFTKDSMKSFEAVSALFPTNPEIKLDRTQIRPFIETTDEFFRFFGTPVKRQVAFTYVINLGKSLIETGQPDLVTLGTYIQSSTREAQQKLEATMSTLEQTEPGQKAFLREMQRKAARAIMDHTRYLTPEQEDAVRVQLGEKRGLITRTNPGEYFKKLATRIESGDQKAYGIFCRWALQTTGLPNGLTASSGLNTLRSLAGALGSENSRKYIERSDELPSNIPPSSDFYKLIMENYYQGNSGPLFEMVRTIASLNTDDPRVEDWVYGRNKILEHFVGQIKLFDGEKAVIGIKSVSELIGLKDLILDMGYFTTMLNTIRKLDWGEASYSADGAVDVENGLPMALTVGKDIKDIEEEITRQSFGFPAGVDASTIAGLNGGGKTQLLMLMASMLFWEKVSGYGPGKKVTLPQVRPEFITCMINAGQSTEVKSSFQNEIDRHIDFLGRYIAAGAPRNGYVFFDEPLASTSSEDQIGILGALINFYQSRDVKVVFTNHNHDTYDMLRKLNINFSAIGFLSEGGEPNFKPTAYDSSKIDEVPSQGIAVAKQFRLDSRIIQVAEFSRSILDQQKQPATA